jgi:hypothetical protein
MGIPPLHMNDYRDKNDILDSEGIKIIEVEGKSGSESKREDDEDDAIHVPSQPDEGRQSQKRGLSSLSTTSSSAAQDKSSIKKHQGTVR